MKVTKWQSFPDTPRRVDINKEAYQLWSSYRHEDAHLFLCHSDSPGQH
jgi:hypothetical protein